MAKAKKRYLIEREFQEFGDYLQQMRLKAGLTQREVAEVLAYSSAQFISNFEAGIALPPLAKLKVLIKLYGMPKDQVIEKIVSERARILDRRL